MAKCQLLQLWGISRRREVSPGLFLFLFVPMLQNMGTYFSQDLFKPFLRIAFIFVSIKQKALLKRLFVVPLYIIWPHFVEYQPIILGLNSFRMLRRRGRRCGRH